MKNNIKANLQVKMGGLILFLVLALFFIFPSLNVKASSNVIQRGAAVTQDESVPASYREHAVEFKASDGTKLIGYVLGSGNKGITLGHANGWTLHSMVPFANELVEKGYKVIMWDYRNNKPSDVYPDTDSRFFRIDLDVLAAVEVLKEEGVNQFFMLGASIGGTSTAVAASQTANLVGLGILSSPRNSGGGVVDALSAVQKITVPSFFAVSKDDFSGDYYTEVKALYDASASSNKVFKTIDSSEHGFNMLLTPDKYLEGTPKETPGQFTKEKDKPLMVKLNQELLDFIDQSFGKKDTTTSTSLSKTPRMSSSSKEQQSTSNENKKSTKDNSFLIFVGIFGGLVVVGLGIILYLKRK